VEREQPPQRILAAARLEDGSLRERPLFAYPERAKYVGGNVDEARSFVGAMPTREPDDHFNWVGAYRHAPTGAEP
jgi:feruloyl esterase